MSSPHEPQAGPLQPEEPVAFHQSTRPFTASDTRGGDLLTVLVHFGRHLDALANGEGDGELDGPDPGDYKLNTYVVAAVGAFAGSRDRVQCRRAGDLRAQEPCSPALESRVLYEQKCSPYAVTRVVEGGASPSWNEVLAIPLPAGWGDQLDTTAAEAGTPLALRLELVERGASHQEDFLLATCVIPLAHTGCQLQQRRLALAFPSEATLTQASSACIYVSLYATPPRQVSGAGPLEQVEITVESFTPVVATGSEDEGLPLDCASLAALIHLRADDGAKSSIFDPVEEFALIENLFTHVQDDQTLPEAPATGSKQVGVTPSCSSTTGSASGVYDWFFPLGFALAAGNNQDASAAAVEIALFKTSSAPRELVGRGQLQLTAATAQRATKDGAPLRHTVIPIALDGDNLLGHLAVRLRWWDAAAWSAFVDGIPARRVVCTNRWKRSPRSTLAWMGALLRGLNRHPVASICDAGGVSGVLAELLAHSSGEQNPQDVLLVQQHTHPATQVTSKATSDTSPLLTEQLAHLQAEGTAQRHQIDRLQNELDTRLAAIKTCGLEIVALRREARLKDELLQQLKEQVDTAQRREQQQLAELLASTTGNGSTLPVHQAASQRFTLLASKYKELDHEYQAVKQQLADAQRSLSSFADLETRHATLQEAHMVQAALVQRLQREKQHATALKKAVRMQEKVIRQFEQAVAQQSAEASQRSPMRQYAPGAEQPDAAGEDSGGRETREALLRVRVQVLEQQLQTNAREAAAEMSALRMRILELETAESRRTGK